MEKGDSEWNVVPLDYLSVVTPERGSKFNEFIERYYLFNLSGGRKKIKILLSDILLIRALKGGHQDKLLYMKGNTTYIIRGYKFNYLIKISGFLIRVNKSDLVSPEAVDVIDEDSITLNSIIENGKPMYLSLSRTYKKTFLSFFHYNEV